MTDSTPENESRRLRKLRSDVAAFVFHSGKQRKYNDRHIDRKVRERVRKMRPEEFAELLELDEDDREAPNGP